MSKEAFNPYIAQVKREHFVQKAVTEGVLEKIKMSERDQNIGILTTFSEMPYYQIGALYLNQETGDSLKKSRIEKIYKNFLRNTYKVSSLELQNSHPLEEILTTRAPLLKNESASSKIREAIKKGITDPKQLQERTGLNSQGLGNARSILKNRGVDVPSSQAYPDFKRKIKQEDDFEKLQEILDNYYDKLQGFLDHHRNDKDGALTSLFRIVKLAGLDISPTRDHTSLIFAFLKNNEKTKKLPKEIIILKNKPRSPIVLWKHKDIIIDVLKNDPLLQKFKQDQHSVLTEKEIYAIIQRLTSFQVNDSELLENLGINMNFLNRESVRNLMKEFSEKTRNNPSYKKVIAEDMIESACQHFIAFLASPRNCSGSCIEVAESLVKCFGNKDPGKNFWGKFKATKPTCSRINKTVEVNI